MAPRTASDFKRNDVVTLKDIPSPQMVVDGFEHAREAVPDVEHDEADDDETVTIVMTDSGDDAIDLSSLPKLPELRVPASLSRNEKQARFSAWHVPSEVRTRVRCYWFDGNTRREACFDPGALTKADAASDESGLSRGAPLPPNEPPCDDD